MRGWVRISLGLSFMLAIGSLSAETRYSMMVIDTGLHDPFIYDRFFKLASQAGFDPLYYGLADLVDRSEDIINNESSACTVVLLEDAFLAQQNDSPLAKKVLELILQQSNKKNMVTYLMVPSQHQWTMKKSKQSPFLAYNKLLEPFGIFFNAMGNIESIATHKAQGIDFIGLSYQVKVQQQFRNPFAWVGSYATSLQAVAQESSKGRLHIKGDSIGILIPNAQKERRLFLGNSMVASYSSITENFRLFPLHQEKQKKIEEDIFAGLCYLHHTVAEVQGGVKTKLLPDKKLHYPLLRPEQPNNKSSKNKKVFAWMELDVFADAKLIVEQDRIIQAIIDSKIDAAWLSIAPNQYFSCRAKFADRLDLLKHSLTRFSQQLKKACVKHKRAVPEIFISFEIANNFVDKHLHPQEKMVDLYGIEYSDVPAPLDRSWWQEEVIESARKFVAFWKKHARGLEINGFFLDLEMYLRSETGVGEFPGNAIGSQADFAFINPENRSVAGLVQDLVDQKKMNLFYQQLMQQAEDLGRWLKASLQEIVPNAAVACYGANVSIDWFYQGLYRGLSSKEDPLILCSFTTHFNDFKKACEAKNIYVDYYAVLMLSHMQKESDFSLFSRLYKQNDGVWLNKLSRLSFPYQPQEWHKAEQTSLDCNGRKKLLDFIAKNR